MITPIVTLVLMMAPYIVLRLLSAVTQRDYDARGAAVIGLTILFIFTGIGQFIGTGTMAQMLPSWIPGRVRRVPLVYLTGVLEFAIAAGFVARKSRPFTGWVAAALLVGFFPANTLNHIPMGGHQRGPVYLLVRAPFQVIILLWVYWFTISGPDSANRKEIADILGKALPI